MLELRLRLSATKGQLREFSSDIETVKLGIREQVLALFDGDIKRVGPSESARDDVYARAYLDNEVLQGLIHQQREAQSQVDQLTAELEGLLDQAKAERIAVDAKRTDAIYACIEVLRDHGSRDSTKAAAEGILVQAGAA